MEKIKNLRSEYKAGALLGLTGLVLSLIIGLIFRVKMGTLIFRAIVVVIVFSLLGIGLAIILKRFVPEFYNLLSGAGRNEETDPEGGKPDLSGEKIGASFEKTISSDIDEESVYNKGDEDISKVKPDKTDTVATKDTGEFAELNEDNLTKYETVEDKTLESSLNISEGKMGKHILEKQKIARYEPKLMAQAIRTMMSRNQD